MGRLISDWYRDGEVLASKVREQNQNKCNCSSSNQSRYREKEEKEPVPWFMRTIYGSFETGLSEEDSEDEGYGFDVFGSLGSTEVDENETESYIEVERELFAIPSTPPSTRPSTPPNLSSPFQFPEIDLSQTPHTPSPRRDVLSGTAAEAVRRRMPNYSSRRNDTVQDYTNNFTRILPTPRQRGRAYNDNLSNITEADSELLDLSLLLSRHPSSSNSSRNPSALNATNNGSSRGNANYMRCVFDELSTLEPGSPEWNALTARALRELAPGGLGR